MTYTYPLYRKWKHTCCIVRFDGLQSCTVVVTDNEDSVGKVLDPIPDHENTYYWEPLSPLQLAALQLKEHHAIQDITSSDI